VVALGTRFEAGNEDGSERWRLRWVKSKELRTGVAGKIVYKWLKSVGMVDLVQSGRPRPSQSTVRLNKGVCVYSIYGSVNTASSLQSGIVRKSEYRVARERCNLAVKQRQEWIDM